MPKRLAPIRACLDGPDVTAPAHVDACMAATLLGWWDRKGAQLTAEGHHLLATAPDSEPETGVFAAALLENPPLSTIASELLLGEWLELLNLAPELVRLVGLPTSQARWLVPGLLGWRDELRSRGWNPRRVAEHLRVRTAWMEGLSTRGRDVLGRLGLHTRERVLALDIVKLRELHRCREETLGEIERFQAQIQRPPIRPIRPIRPAVPGPTRSVAVEVPVVEDPIPRVRAAARKLVEHRGCASIAALARECDVADLSAVRAMLAADPDVRWLDDVVGWFWIPELARNRLVTRIDKVLAIAEELDVLELREALARDRRMDCDPPPPPVLAALCEQLGDCELCDDGTRVRDVRPRDPAEVLSSVEQDLVAMLRAHGPIVPARGATRLLVEAGINEHTAAVYLANSPIVRRVDGEGYALVGETADAIPEIDGETTLAELAGIANMSIAEIVALAMSDAGRTTRRSR